MRGFNAFVQLFMPKDKVFYSLFEEVADGVARMGELLKEVVKEPDYDKRTALISQVQDQEHINDEFTHRIFTELGRNFIAPFDREDIHYLASALDDDQTDRRIEFERSHGSVDAMDHFQREGIERLRPRQGDDAGPAQMFEADLVASAKIHRERIPPPRRRD